VRVKGKLGVALFGSEKDARGVSTIDVSGWGG
jgi:hypothetical protein